MGILGSIHLLRGPDDPAARHHPGRRHQRAVQQLSNARGAPQAGPSRAAIPDLAAPSHAMAVPLRTGARWSPHHLPPRSAPPPSSASGAGHWRVPRPLPRRREGITLGSSSPASSRATSRPWWASGVLARGEPHRRPEVGGWFFPTKQWWILMLWVVPPFLALTLSLVLRLSPGSRTRHAASAGLRPGDLPRSSVQPVFGALFGAGSASV